MPASVDSSLFTDLALDLDTQTSILHSTLLHPLIKSFPPHNHLAFAKSLYKAVEDQNEEVSEELLKIIMSFPPSKALSGYKHYPVPSSGEVLEPLWVTTLEDTNIISNGTTGLRTWGASLTLAEYFLSSPELVSKTNRILELGSGCGMLGILLAILGANVTLTDTHQMVLDRLVENVSINFANAEASGGSMSVLDFDWESEEFDILEEADLIVAADVVYHPDNIIPLCNVLKQFLFSRNTSGDQKYALIASTIRNEETDKCFKDELGKSGIKFERLSLDLPKQFIRVDTDLPVEILKLV
ncbi:Protein fam86a [Nowakowskiella sp. JEL0407]|nr:Protein fam86a [Nowakowskiella sp. JEL0407]